MVDNEVVLFVKVGTDVDKFLCAILWDRRIGCGGFDLVLAFELFFVNPHAKLTAEVVEEISSTQEVWRIASDVCSSNISD